MAFAVIEAANLWSLFCRAYYLSVMIGCVSAAGTKVVATAGTASRNDAIGIAVRRFRPRANPKADGSWHRRDEPTWHDPTMFLDLMSHVGASNIRDLDDAFSTSTRVFIDLPVFRNYYAHRNHRSMHAAQSVARFYGIPSAQSPSDILRRRALGRPRLLLEDWLDDLRFTAEFVCN